MLLYNPADAMAPEVTVAGRVAIWSLWKAPLGELQQRPLGFWITALPSYATLSLKIALSLLLSLSGN